MATAVECTMWQTNDGTLFRTKQEADKYEASQLALEMFKAMWGKDSINAHVASQYFYDKAYDAGWRVVRAETLEDTF